LMTPLPLLDVATAEYGPEITAFCTFPPVPPAFFTPEQPADKKAQTSRILFT